MTRKFLRNYEDLETQFIILKIIGNANESRVPIAPFEKTKR
jgi:hypothetical protein